MCSVDIRYNLWYTYCQQIERQKWVVPRLTRSSLSVSPDGKAAAFRDYGFDNIRAALILLVVFCHLCESFSDFQVNRLYLLIYSFHMPCFLFVTGYFARFDAKKLAKRLLLPYGVFQVLYTLFDCLYVHPETEFVLQFTLPYWITWYLLTVFCLCFLIPILETNRPWVAMRNLALLTLVSLYAGTDSNAGNYLALGRTLVFLPCFFLGYYSGTVFAPTLVEGLRQRRWVLLPVLAVGVLLYEYTLKRAGGTCWLLYGAYSYKASNAGPLLRLLTLAGSMTWMLLLICLSPSRRIPLVSEIGARTMPIYLLHGFVQRVLYKTHALPYGQSESYMLALGITVVIVILFSRKCFHRIFRFLF